MPLSIVAPIRIALPLLGAVFLVACDSKDSAPTNMVSMKDLEVVDGTTSDAMTDLDGVQTEGTALAPVSSGGGNGTLSAAAPANETAPAENTQVLSDQ